MSLRTIFALFTVILLFVGGCDGDADNQPDVFDQGEVVTLVDESECEINLQVSFNDLAIESVQTAQGEFVELHIDGFNDYGLVGEPALPAVRQIVSLPLGAEVTVTAEPAMVDRLFVDGLVMPNQPPVEKLPGAIERAQFAFDTDAYDVDAFAVGRWAKVVEEGMMRNHRIGLLEVTPVDYNPATGELLVARDLRITIHLANADIDATQALDYKFGSPGFDALLKTLAINKGVTWSLFAQPYAGAGYLVIYANTFAGSAALNNFIADRNAEGWSVTAVNVNTIGNTVIAIRNYIINFYNNAPNLTFIELIGDTDTIPNAVGFGSDYPATDLYYSCLSGSDYYPDVLLGRLPARTTAQLASMVDKIDSYNSVAGLKDVTFMASTDNHAITENTHNVVYQYFMQPHGYAAHKLYTYTYNATTQQVKNQINAGTNYAIYSGHGAENQWADGPVFTQSDVASLTNTRYPFVASFACLTGKYTVAECFAETWLRDDHGASAMIASSVTSYWTEDDWYEKGMFYGMYNFPWEGYPDQVWTASASLCGKFIVWRMSNFGGGDSMRYFEMYNLFGDPSMKLYTY